MFHVAIRHGFPGMAYGMAQPCLVVHLTAAGRLDPTCESALAKRCEATLLKRPHPPVPESNPMAHSVLNWIATLQLEAGLPMLAHGQLRQALQQPDGSWRSSLLVPHLPGLPRSAKLALDWMAHWIQPKASDNLAALRDSVDELVAGLHALAPRDKNTIHFLRAANESGIPWDPVAGNCHQFGWGMSSRRMESTYTDQTPVLGAKLARQKHHAAVVLRRAGLPAPPHALAKSADEAVHIAAQLGYPVVVKPADKDGGVGVAAGLKTETAVRHAFEDARKISSLVLVEKHFVGKDFRLLVFDRKLVWTIQRQPGGVTGDGERTIEQLIERVNSDPRRGSARGAALKTLVLDDEALELLEEQAMDTQSVPVQGEFVRLRRAANVAMGGISMADNDHVHPDNQQLAEQAAQAFGLDIAGIDLLIPDIGRSWRESGAAICEVNGQPQFGTSTQQHLHGEILRSLVPNLGRIPVLVVVGEPDAELLRQITQRLRQRSAGIGIATSMGATMDGNAMGQHSHVYLAARALLSNKDVAALIIVLNDASALSTGLPVDRFDRMLVTTHLMAGRTSLTKALVDMFSPNCLSPVLVNGADARCVESCAHVIRQTMVVPPNADPTATADATSNAQALAAALTDGLHAAGSMLPLDSPDCTHV